MVKGLAKHENRLRHVLRDKCVDASLFGEERLLPNDKNYFNRRVRVSALGRECLYSQHKTCHSYSLKRGSHAQHVECPLSREQRS